MKRIIALSTQRHPWPALAVLCILLGFAACDTETAPGTDSVDTADVTGAAETSDTGANAETSAPGDGEGDDVDGDDNQLSIVGPNASHLSMGDRDLVWAEDGDLWHYNPATGERRILVDDPNIQKHPVADGTHVVWADNRTGDFDLWTMNLADDTPMARLLVYAIGDQEQPSLSGELLVWVDRRKAPHTAAEAEIWSMNLDQPASARAITDDEVEQTQPHCRGRRMVWADYRNSDAGIYQGVNDPELNNADIIGYDLDIEEEFIVTVEPSKQLRPVIDGDLVAWMDWRGVNPEPKYSEFLLYGKRLGQVEERRIAHSSWDQPDLWQRPALNNGVIAWIAEPVVEADGTPSFTTGVWAAALFPIVGLSEEPQLIAESTGILQAVVLHQQNAAWLGAGQLGFRSIVDALKR